MRLPDPSGVSSKSELRQCAIRFLSKWVADLNRDKVRLHLPRRLGLMRLLPGMPFHLSSEVFLQISGYTTFEFPEESCRVGPGEICLVSRGLPHRERIEAWRGPFYNLMVGYHPDRVTVHLARQAETGIPEIAVLLELPVSDSGLLADLLKNVVDWFHEGDGARRFAAKGVLLANLSAVLATLKKEPAEVHEPVKVMQVRQLIVQHLAEPELSVNWIGKSLQSRPDYVSRLFRESMGIPLVAYITERRMVHARDLLVSSTLNISEISQASGYEDSSYFTRVFRKETGMAPREYRNQALRQTEPLASK